MEYYSAKDKNLAIKIFELGLKRFSDKPEYVRQYMDFMSNMNDDNNTRLAISLKYSSLINGILEFFTKGFLLKISLMVIKWNLSGTNIWNSNAMLGIYNQCKR